MTVYLVGAGPGDPGLLTLRGSEVLAGADVVVHDRLAEPALLDLAPAGAERVDVGKRPGGPVDQQAINAVLVERARAGLSVVRLKGGDPFVFGRGGEEAEALLSAGVAFEVVPGVTAAVAAPAYAGVPLTHRGVSTSFTVVTGHSRQAVDEEVDWASLARTGATIVVLMGVAHRDRIAEALIRAGRRPDTPVLAVMWGTRPDQRSVRTDLAGLAGADVVAPATIVIGEVAGLDLRWFETRPLHGWTVVVTRARIQASALAARLRRAGALPLEVPVVEVLGPADGGEGLARAVGDLASHDWLALTSANAVERLFEHVRDGRALAPVRVAAVGEATAAALAQHGVVADLVPPSADAGSLASALGAAGPPGSRLLHPRQAGGHDTLGKVLRSAGWTVEEVDAYRVEPCKASSAVVRQVTAADAVTFTSGSTVEGFVGAFGAEAAPPVVACIGPVTADAARAAGMAVDVVPGQRTVGGLVEALETWAAGRDRAGGRAAGNSRR